MFSKIVDYLDFSETQRFNLANNAKDHILKYHNLENHCIMMEKLFKKCMSAKWELASFYQNILKNLWTRNRNAFIKPPHNKQKPITEKRIPDHPIGSLLLSLCKAVGNLVVIGHIKSLGRLGVCGGDYKAPSPGLPGRPLEGLASPSWPSEPGRAGPQKTNIYDAVE